MERSLAWRLGLSAILIPGLFGLFFLDHKLGEPAPLLLALTLLLSLRGSWELNQLLTVRNIHPHCTASMIGSVLILLFSWAPHLAPAWVPFSSFVGISIGMAVTILALLTTEAFRFRTAGQSMESLGASLLIICYGGVLLALTAQLRWTQGAQAGYLLLGSLVIVTKLGDIGAYTIGRLFGNKKMAPYLSPGKTWAGFAGALLGAALGSLSWLSFAPSRFDADWSPPSWATMILYGLIIGLAGLMGDLCESLIKRDVGQKDSASLLPGFGGVLDLLDSILYAGPVALILWHLLPLVTW